MEATYLDVPLEVRIKGERISGLYPQYILHLEVGEITHLLTIDPNFQRDILVYDPWKGRSFGSTQRGHHRKSLAFGI